MTNNPVETTIPGEQAPGGRYEANALDWALFFGAVFFFLANLFASIAIFPGYSLFIGSSPFLAGLQNTAFGIFAVLLRFFFGPVMDRRGPKPLMLLGAFTFATAPLLLLIDQSYGMLLAARIYQSLGLAVFLPGVSTMAAAMAPPGRIGTYLGATRIFINLGLLMGPAGALLVIDRFGYSQWFALSAAISAISMALLAKVKVPTVAGTEKIAGSRAQILRALSDRRVYPVIGGIALYSFTYSAVVSFAAVHIGEIGAGASVFFILLGAAGIVASLAAGALSDRLGRHRLAWPLLSTLGIGTAAFYFLPQAPFLVIACALLVGLAIQGSSLVFAAWLIDISKPELRATTISIQENTIDIMFAVGAMVFGLAAQGPGLGSAFLATGIITLALVFPLGKKSAANMRGDGS